LPTELKRWLYAVWIVFIGAFAVFHAVHLSADFPNHSPWVHDWAKYTDEGWYGNAAIRSHLFGNWYIPGDFNPAPAVPVWPFLEWILFFFTGVTVEAARGLAVAFFFANLLLTCTLLRSRGPRWMALLALTLIATNPFLYCFSRLAILEPMLTTLMLIIVNIGVRLPLSRRPLTSSVAIGALFTLMMLTKTTAIFLLPAIAWAMWASFWRNSESSDESLSATRPRWFPRPLIRCAVAAACAFALTFGLWMAFIVHFGLYADYKYLFFINNYIKPKESYWPLISLWWSVHGTLWVDHLLIPLAGLLILGVILAGTVFAARNTWGRPLLLDPVFGASVLAALGYILFMAYQNHPQPRYFAVVAVFTFIAIALGANTLMTHSGPTRAAGVAALAFSALAIAINSTWTLSYVASPEYTFVTAAGQMARYIDEHPNGKRLLVSISGDEITLLTHLPALCDDFGTPTPGYPDLPTKLARYQPGWWATWNSIDPGTLEDIHTHFSLEQVASFRAFDDPDRSVLVLFKLHPLPNGQARQIEGNKLQVALPDDKVDIPIE
jgi:hypothetical protein